MSKKITDPKLKMFIDFFGQQGVTFVDTETGETTTTIGEENIGGESKRARGEG